MTAAPPALASQPAAEQAAIRRNSVLLAGVLLLVWTGRQLLPTFGGVIGVDLTGSRDVGGALFAVYMLAGSGGAWLAGRWMDHSGRRPALGSALVVAALGALLVGAAVLGRSFGLALAGSAVMGLGLGAGQLARLAAADMYPLARRARAISSVMMGAALGAIIGPPITAAVAGAAAQRGLAATAGPWLVIPLAFLVGVALVWALRPDPRDVGVRLLAAELRGHAWPPIRPRRVLLRQRAVWASIIAITALETTMVMIMAIVPLGLADLGTSLGVISLLMSVHFFGMFGLSIPIGWLADRLGRKPVLASGCLVSAAGCAVIALGSSVWLIGPGFFGVGLGWSLGYLTATTILADVTTPFERGGLLGIMDFSVAIGGAVAALGGGVLYGEAGLWLVGLAGVLLTVPPFLVGLQLRERTVGAFDP